MEMTAGEAIRLTDRSAPPSIPRSSTDRSVSFEDLVRAHHASVSRLAHRLVGWRPNVEDIVQDVFLAAFSKFDGFRSEASTWTWLAAITINRCRSERRRSLLRLRWLAWAKHQKHESSAVPAEQDETAARVRQVVAALPARNREVVVLFYLEQCSTAFAVFIFFLWQRRCGACASRLGG